MDRSGGGCAPRRLPQAAAHGPGSGIDEFLGAIRRRLLPVLLPPRCPASVEQFRPPGCGAGGRRCTTVQLSMSPSVIASGGAQRRRRHAAPQCQLRRLRVPQASSPDTPPTATAPPGDAAYWAHAAAADHRPPRHPRGLRSAAANESERERRSMSSPPRRAAACCSPTPAIVAANIARASSCVGVTLIVPENHRLGERPPLEVVKARIRPRDRVGICAP